MPANPFEFEAANKFTVEEMVDYFIPGGDFTRSLESRKNILLLGDRGTGKTMALRYYSLQVQYALAQQSGEIGAGAKYLELIGVYIPCRKLELGKTEPELLDSFLGRLHGEHLLVTAMISHLSDALNEVSHLITKEEEEKLRAELSMALEWTLPPEFPIFEALGIAARHESIQAQRALNEREADSHYENIATFPTTFQPLVDIIIRRVAAFKKSNFSLMYDDAEDLSVFQNETLNSWIAVRDTSRISFKVASSAVDRRTLRTISGGGLLERHDYILVDLEQDFQNSDAAYGKLARKIVNRRLERHGVTSDAESFFPTNPAFVADLEKAKAKALQQANEKGLIDRQIRDYVHKMERAIYFRDRAPQANRPPYSGFDLLVHVSTGVIRYLLEPCFEMYYKALDATDKETLAAIPPSIQTECLHQMSKRRWEWMTDFKGSVKGCTRDDAKHIRNFADKLGVLFKQRLYQHQSEPRAISFSVSAWQQATPQQRDDLERLLKMARRAQVLFERLSTGKDEGRSDVYYTFDRLLWIDRGLDPVGQNARVSLEAKYIWEAAFENKPLPFDAADKRTRSLGGVQQLDMFGTDDL